MVRHRGQRVSMAGAALAACSMLGACSACPPPLAGAAPSEEFSLDVKLLPGRNRGRGVWEAEILLPPEGDATVRFEYLNFHLPAFRIDVEPFRIGSDSDPRAIEFERQAREKTLHPVQRVALDGEDRKALQQAIDRSGFFGDWPAGEDVTDQDSWIVTAHRGGVVKSREIYAQPEFKESERLLWRILRQGVGEWAPSAGRQDILDYLLDDDRPDLLLHPERLPRPAPPAAPVKSACPKPECSRAGGPMAPASTDASKGDQTRSAAAAIRGAGTLALEAEVGGTVRGRFDSSRYWTIVEVCLKEIVAAEAGQPVRVRYMMRLSTEDGRTEAVAKRAKNNRWETLYTDSIFEVESGGSFHVFFSCPYGTGWEIDTTADVLDGGRVRFTVGGYWTPCTK